MFRTKRFKVKSITIAPLMKMVANGKGRIFLISPVQTAGLLYTLNGIEYIDLLVKPLI